MLDLYSRGGLFESWPGHQSSHILSLFPLVPPGKFSGKERSLPSPSLIIIHQSSHYLMLLGLLRNANKSHNRKNSNANFIISYPVSGTLLDLCCKFNINFQIYVHTHYININGAFHFNLDVTGSSISHAHNKSEMQYPCGKINDIQLRIQSFFS